MARVRTQGLAFVIAPMPPMRGPDPLLFAVSPRRRN